MPKLHELLPVEGQLKGQAEKTRTDLAHTFEKKRHLFEESRKIYQPYEEGKKEEVEEISVLHTTVPEELAWISRLWAKAIDTSYRVAEGNTVARADVVLDDGTVFLKNLPATALLELEKRASEIHTLVSAIPTLDSTKGFSPDPSRKDVYAARPVVRKKTEKVQEPLVLLQPTKEHPGQAQVISKDKEIGVITTLEWSGMTTPAIKAAMLERAEEISRAIKQARSRANDTQVPDVPQIGLRILNYVLGTAISGEAQTQG